MNKMTICKTCSNEVAKSAKICPHCGAKLKGRKLKFIFGGIIALIILLFAFSGGSSDSDENINLVKNGFLGNYKTVSISKIIDSNFSNADIKWSSFKSSEKNIVEVQVNDSSINKTMILQFSINSNNTFNVAHLNINGQALSEPYDVKLFLDGLYEYYAEASSDKSIIADTDTSNDTLKGSK